MAKITTSLGASLTVKVNNDNSVYSTTSTNSNIIIYAIDTQVPSTSVEKENKLSYQQ